MKLREEFVLKALEPKANKAELCREYGVSRKTGYKWLKRYQQRGLDGLADLSRQPHSSLLRASGEAAVETIRLRREHPRWGPKKLRAILLRSMNPSEVPSVRTIARILDRAGEPLARRPRRRIAMEVTAAPKVEVNGPNDLWSVDFKGWWRTKDGSFAEPLTVRDAHSRYVLCVELVESRSTERIKRVFERLFEKHGMPQTILVDNGSPFVSMSSRGGLTCLSAWWVAVGIRVNRSRLAHPEDNGAHERMHGDIHYDLEVSAEETFAAQQAACDRWRVEFNEVRPHEALAQRAPAEIYRRSPRSYSGPRQTLYAPGYVVRKVSSDGKIQYGGTIVRVGAGLRGYSVGLELLGGEKARVQFYDVDLGVVTLPTGN